MPVRSSVRSACRFRPASSRGRSSARELEDGVRMGLEGALGDGGGKWQLTD